MPSFEVTASWDGVEVTQVLDTFRLEEALQPGFEALLPVGTSITIKRVA